MEDQKLKVIIFGATGMVGKGILLECLEDERVGECVVVNRSTLGMNHKKLTELISSDLGSDKQIENLRNLDACFFSLGVSAIGMKEAEYHKITYELTAKVADMLKVNNSNMLFNYVSGTGTDSSEKGRSMWARIKGRTENMLLANFPNSYMFRPGYIQPLKGIRSKTKWYQALYDIFGFIYPIVSRVFPGAVTNTTALGKAMINSVAHGYEKNILENKDINRLAQT
jgi:hypothetical protein